MAKTATIHMRIEPELKQDVENVFRELGMTTSEAINMFLRQVSAQRGVPFDVRIPNAETRQAIEEARAGIGVTTFESIAEWQASMRADD